MLTASCIAACGDDPAGLPGDGEPPVGEIGPPGTSPNAPRASADGGASACEGLDRHSFEVIPIDGASTDRPAAWHGDINLALRDVVRADGARRALIDASGPTDPNAPRLRKMIRSSQQSAIDFFDVYRVSEWDWSCNCKRSPMSSPEVQLVGLRASEGEPVRAPERDPEIYPGKMALVLLATSDTLTLKYTREDSVVSGYTVHISGPCIDPGLVDAYERANGDGRRALPAIGKGETIGVARSNEVRVAVRDTGRWMDPRSRKDWW